MGKRGIILLHHRLCFGGTRLASHLAHHELESLSTCIIVVVIMINHYYYYSLVLSLLQTLVEKRNMAIQAMVEEAAKSGGHHHQKSQLRPLHLINFKDDNLQEIDLTEESVLAKDTSQHFQQGLATVEGSGSGAQS